MKNNISRFSDFKIYPFSTVVFATLIQHDKKSRYRSGTGQIYRYWTGPNSTETGTGPDPEFRSGPNCYFDNVYTNIKKSPMEI